LTARAGTNNISMDGVSCRKSRTTAVHEARLISGRKSVMQWKVGDTASLSKTITTEDIELFATLSGDANPVHLNRSFAEKTRFKGRIAHGMWAASLVSAVLGTRLPGPGTIYLSQSIKFQAPVYPNDTITATVTVTKARDDKPIVTLETVCHNQKGDTVLTGEAVVLVETVA
jgi:acyl dehydratase